MAVTPPKQFPSTLESIKIANLVPIQSAQLSVTSTSSSVTFTNIPSTNRLSFIIANTGTKNGYIAAGSGSATAVASSSTPTPSSGTGVMSTCHCILAGTQITLDFLGAVDTIAAICAGTDTTTLEISLCE